MNNEELKIRVGANIARLRKSRGLTQAELAEKIRDAGKVHAYRKIMDAVADFDILNAKFDAVLKELTRELN